MKVLYDFQAFSYQKFGGVSNCFVQIIKNLPNDVLYEVAIKESNNIHLIESGLVTIQSERLNLDNFISNLNFSQKSHLFNILQNRFPYFFKSSYNVNKQYAELVINKNEFDIFHSTYFDAYFIELLKKPFVTTIHDMIPEIFGISKGQIKGKYLQAHEAKRIIAVSENTKKDIIKILKIPENKIDVVYHGFTPKVLPFAEIPIVDVPYILYVGDRSAKYKNFSYFVEQTSFFLDKYADYQVICTGQSFTKEDEELFEFYGVKNRFVHKFCNLDELNNLYANAFCFVYPSYYEGFGIPILEAYNAGCIVVLNKKSCFPEIAGDAAIYFDSDNINDNLCQKLEDLHTMSSITKKAQLSLQMKRLAMFSWERSAEQLANIYSELLGA